ncbi:unnamed protein product [Vicia faba]|uniref:Uncharacterized protein n=1 Tax=Vicia faba TaxID=3906 RepID=A0AAV0ZSU1_VICFA|nr:unnamed protein product [Vicia faba]
MEQLELENQTLRTEVATLKESIERNNATMEALLARLEREDTPRRVSVHEDAIVSSGPVSQLATSAFVFGDGTDVDPMVVTEGWVPRYHTNRAANAGVGRGNKNHVNFELGGSSVYGGMINSGGFPAVGKGVFNAEMGNVFGGNQNDNNRTMVGSMLGPFAGFSNNVGNNQSLLGGPSNGQNLFGGQVNGQNMFLGPESGRNWTGGAINNQNLFGGPSNGQNLFAGGPSVYGNPTGERAYGGQVAMPMGTSVIPVFASDPIVTVRAQEEESEFLFHESNEQMKAEIQAEMKKHCDELAKQVTMIEGAELFNNQGYQNQGPRREPIDLIPVTYASLFPRLLAKGLIEKRPAPAPPAVPSKFYNPEAHCELHSGGARHDIENFFVMKNRVQTLVRLKQLNFQDCPNVKENTLPSHGKASGSANMIEKVEDEVITEAQLINTPLKELHEKLVKENIITSSHVLRCEDCEGTPKGCVVVLNNLQVLIDEGILKVSKKRPVEVEVSVILPVFNDEPFVVRYNGSKGKVVGKIEGPMVVQASAPFPYKSDKVVP